MKIAILGANGATGRQAVERALATGHQVVAVVRDAAKVTARDERLQVVAADCTRAPDVERALAGVDAVVSAVGPRDKKSTVVPDTVAAVVAAMHKNGVRRLVTVSSLGVGDSAEQARRTSFVFGRIVMPLFMKEPFANHERAEAAVRASGLDWTIVRPVGLNDKPPRGSVDVVPLAEKAPRGFVSRADVARFLVEEATGGGHVGQAVTIC